MERVHCPKHAERSASCVIYDTHAWCYGGCGRIELTELGREASGEPKERFKENLEETRKYIDALPTKTIRCFNFPYDDVGYYVRWLGQLYYKRRNWADNGPKYYGPAGHAKPPFWARKLGNQTVALVEGEISALSVAVAFPEWDVCSPGSASDFKKETSRELLTSVRYYRTVVIIVDDDAPGVGAGIHAAGILNSLRVNNNIVAMSKDANEWHCEHGQEALKKEVEKRLSEALQR